MIQPSGYFCIHRELFNKPIWLNSNSKQKTILITLLGMANYKENQWDYNGKKFKVEPGQFITSIESIAKECGSDVSTMNVRTALTRFVKLEFLTSQSTNRNTLITIVNWTSYQQDIQSTNKQSNICLTSAQQTTNKRLTTNEERKKVIRKEGNNILAFGSQKNVKLTEDEFKNLQFEFPNEADESIEFLSLWLAEKGDKSKSATHNLTIRRWVIDAIKEKHLKPKKNEIKKKLSNVANFDQRDYPPDYFKLLEEDVSKFSGGTK